MTTQPLPPAADVAVIGGGLAGLTAAAVAAQHGVSVVLCEARTLGGRGASTMREGLLHNEGPHALYPAGPGVPVLEGLGVPLAGGAPSPIHVRTAGVVHPAPMRATAALVSRLFSAAEKVDLGRVQLAMSRANADVLDRVSFDAWLLEHAKSAKVRALFSMFARVSTYTYDPDGLPAGTAIVQLAISAKGVRYVDGGWASIVDSLRDTAADTGATVHEHAAVTGVTRDHGPGAPWVVGVGDRVVRARAVVFACGGPRAASRLLGMSDADSTTLDERAGAPVLASVLDLVCDRPVDPGAVFDLDEPLYLSTHHPNANLAGGADARDGRSLVTVMLYHHPDERRPPQEIRAHLRGYFDDIAGGRTQVLSERYLHRMVVTQGRSTVSRGGDAGRPGVDALHEFGPLCFVAGDWVGPTGLLADAAIVSGREAGRQAASATIVR
jgi:glycine/D-amino acid oxidase-like deaminating enzyme